MPLHEIFDPELKRKIKRYHYYTLFDPTVPGTYELVESLRKGFARESSKKFLKAANFLLAYITGDKTGNVEFTPLKRFPVELWQEFDFIIRHVQLAQGKEEV